MTDPWTRGYFDGYELKQPEPWTDPATAAEYSTGYRAGQIDMKTNEDPDISTWRKERTKECF